MGASTLNTVLGRKTLYGSMKIEKMGFDRTGSGTHILACFFISGVETLLN
jgi:hypothetical protein